MLGLGFLVKIRFMAWVRLDRVWAANISGAIFDAGTRWLLICEAPTS